MVMKRKPVKFVVTGTTKRGRKFTEIIRNKTQLNQFKKTHRAFGGKKLRVTKIKR